MRRVRIVLTTNTREKEDMMKKIVSGFLTLSLLCVMGASLARAEHGELTERVTFTQDTLVHNTMVKKGDYRIVFDPAAGELKVMDGDHVVARAKAMMKVNEEKADNDVFYTVTTAAGRALQSVKFGGQREEVVLSDVQSAAASEFEEAVYDEYF
jgi:hypothetical protein